MSSNVGGGGVVVAGLTQLPQDGSDAELFVQDNHDLFRPSSVDTTITVYKVVRRILGAIPSWAWIPLIVFAIVMFVMFVVPALFVMQWVLSNKVATMRIASLGIFVGIVFVGTFFV